MLVVTALSMVSSFIDGILQRWPIIGHPLLGASTTESAARGPYPHIPFPKPATSYRPLLGSDSFDMFADQRFRGETRPAAPTPAPVKTFGGFGGQNPTPSRSRPPFSGSVEAGDFGNLAPRKAPVKTYEASLLSPIKTY